MPKLTFDQAASQMSEAHADLNMWHAIMALMEGSLFSPASEVATERVMKICRLEASRAYARHESGRAALQQKGEAS